jgi:CxxC-x17-CxxC domain-containing protein
MKRKPKQEEASILQQPEFDIAAFMAKMQQQLVTLENKIDSLINKPSERPFRREQQFLRPSGGFDRFRGRENRSQGNEFRDRRLFKVICAECNKECEVPFKPTGDRPVYCKDCFARRKQGGSFQEERSRGPVVEKDFTPRPPSDKKRSRKHQPDGERKPARRRKERA